MNLTEDMDQWRALLNMVSIKGGECLDQLSDYQFLRKGSPPQR
jgi:hypothetical protein